MSRPAKRTRAARKSAQIVMGTVAWAGIYDGKIDTWRTDGPEQLAIWTTRREARRRYECVRKVTIVVLPAPRSGRARA